MSPRLQSLLAGIAAMCIALLFLQEPGFGDDLTYWSFAFDLHERGLIAWQKGSFHDLRWPVWGISWLLQAILGPGLVSYYGVPLLYIGFGSMLAFVFARMAANSAGIAWTAALGFAIHPLLDSICFRPMPDLSEGVWGAAVVFSWWKLMHSEKRSESIGWAALLGAAVFIIEANRITGVFIIPVIALGTLLWFRRQLGWLIAGGLFCIALYWTECGFYAWRFGNWFHDITANMGNAENKGTEPIPVWYLPFRFFDTLWKGNLLAPIYCITAAIGIWATTKRGTILQRVIVVWFAVLFLEYSCAPQPVWPLRPLIRDADRFLAGLAIPMTLLAAFGLAEVLRLVSTRWPKIAHQLTVRPLVTAALGAAAAVLLTSRPFADLGFVPQMRTYMQALPDSTTVFSHKSMREFAYLISGSDAQRFKWIAPNHIMHRTEELEAQVAGADQFWYARKLVWLTTRKKLERKELKEQPDLGSYLDSPEKDWRLAHLFLKGNNPDLIFYCRRQSSDPSPIVLDQQSAELRDLLPALPRDWNKGDKSTIEKEVPLPASLRGKLIRAELFAGSSQVEALNIRIRIRGAGKEVDYLLKPYLYAAGGKEFFVLHIPNDADRAHIQLKFSSKAQNVTFSGLRLFVEEPPRS